MRIVNWQQRVVSLSCFVLFSCGEENIPIMGESLKKQQSAQRSDCW